MDHERRVRIPVAREELHVEARPVPAGRVVVRKHVTTGEEVVDVPLVHDEVSVERVPRGELVDAPPPVREEGDTTIVPVLEEEVVVERRLRLKEELRITRRRREERRTCRVPLRREEVTVERTTPGAEVEQAEEAQEEGGTMETDRFCLVGSFDRRADASAAGRGLLEVGVDPGRVRLSEQRRATGEGLWSKLRRALGRAREPSRSVTLLIAEDVGRERLEACVDVLRHHGAVQVDRRVVARGEQGQEVACGPYEETIPVSEERLEVGKRRERRGGVRVETHVREVPVSRRVRLRDEHVHVERREVDRPAGEDAFEERCLELTEEREVPVVRKEARVVEEVVVGADVEERCETIEDTVRRIEVDVQDLEADLRRDHERRYASSGLKYDEVRPAYEYGRQLAEYEGDRRTSWRQVEPQAREDFERCNPGLWPRYRHAVRRGFERARARR